MCAPATSFGHSNTSGGGGGGGGGGVRFNGRDAAQPSSFVSVRSGGAGAPMSERWSSTRGEPQISQSGASLLSLRNVQALQVHPPPLLDECPPSRTGAAPASRPGTGTFATAIAVTAATPAAWDAAIIPSTEERIGCVEIALQYPVAGKSPFLPDAFQDVKREIDMYKYAFLLRDRKTIGFFTLPFLPVRALYPCNQSASPSTVVTSVTMSPTCSSSFWSGEEGKKKREKKKSRER